MPGVLLALLVLFHGGVATGSLVLCGGDIVNQDYPLRAYWVRHGLATGWMRDSFSGYPFFANIQAGVLYPPNWLYFAGLSVERTASWLALAHLALGGWGFYRMARLRLGRAGSLVAAGLWMCGGYNILRLTNGVVIFTQTLAWLPWVWWSAERCGPRNPRATARLGLFAALQVLAGAPQVVQITWGGVLVWLALRGAFERTWRARAALAAHTAAALLLAAVIVFPQLAATMEMTSRAAGRGEAKDWDYLTHDSLEPHALLTDLCPELFDAGNREETYWGTRAGYHEVNAYLGIGALMLAAFGALAARRDRRWLPGFGVLAAMGLLLALGRHTPVYRLLFDYVPGFGLFRVPARWQVWCVAPLCLLAGWGLERAGRRAEGGGMRDAGRAWLMIVGFFVSGLVVLRVMRDPIFEALGLANFRAAHHPETVEHLRAVAAGSIGWALTMALATGAAGWAGLAGRLARIPAMAILCTVLLLDLLRFWHPFRIPYPEDIPPEQLLSEAPFHRIRAAGFRERFFPGSELVSELRALAPGRIVFTDDVIGMVMDQYAREMSGERPAAYGFENMRGYQPLQLAGYAAEFAAMAPPGMERLVFRSSSLLLPGIEHRWPLDAYNATHILTYLPVVDPESERAFRESGLRRATGLSFGMEFWENPHAAGWAWLSEDPGWPGLDGRLPEQPALHDLVREPDRTRFTIDVPRDGLTLHFAEVDYPGWTIRVREAGTEHAVTGRTGRSIPIERAGRYEVVRQFQLPAATRWGIPVAAVAAIGAAVFAAGLRKKRSDRRDTKSAGKRTLGH